MRLLAHLFVPGHHNHHHPHLIRHSGLTGVLYILLAFTLIYNALFPFEGKVLGFATEISADQIITLTNKQRSDNNLPALVTNSQLALAAQAKAKYMFEKNFWAHNAPDGTTPWFFIEHQGYKYSAAGENLARDFYTSSAVVSAWMDSPGHKANIMNTNYQEIGIGVMNGTLDGKETTLVVQMFGKPLSGVPQTPSDIAQAKPAVVTTAPVTETKPAERATPVEIAQELILPATDRPNNGLVATPQPISSTFLLPRNAWTALTTLSFMQKIYLGLLTMLVSAFLMDSYLLYRRRLFRFSSHSVTHALILIIATVSMVFSGSGFVG
jgi:hypothetical protein